MKYLIQVMRYYHCRNTTTGSLSAKDGPAAEIDADSPASAAAWMAAQRGWSAVTPDCWGAVEEFYYSIPGVPGYAIRVIGNNKFLRHHKEGSI